MMYGCPKYASCEVVQDECPVESSGTTLDPVWVQTSVGDGPELAAAVKVTDPVGTTPDWEDMTCAVKVTDARLLEGLGEEVALVSVARGFPTTMLSPPLLL